MDPTKTTILWIHGKESGPHGSKYEALVAAGFNVVAPDLRGVDLPKRVDIVEPIVRKLRPFIVGSSLGGITAVLAAKRVGGKLPGMVLCAPALTYDGNDPADLAVDAPVTIVHGVHDDIVPIDVSRRYAELHGAHLVEVDDDHRLSTNSSLALIVSHVR